MIDRTDLQLMLCEQIMETPTDELVELMTQLTGAELQMYDEAKDIIIGEVESLAIEDPPMLKKWLGFLLYALGERLARQEPCEAE